MAHRHSGLVGYGNRWWNTWRVYYTDVEKWSVPMPKGNAIDLAKMYNAQAIKMSRAEIRKYRR